MRASLKIHWNRELAITILFFGPQLNYYIACLLSMNGLPTVSTFIYFALYVVGIFSYLFTLRRPAPFFLAVGMVGAIVFSYLFNREAAQYMGGSSFSSSPVVLLLCVYFPVFLLMIDEVDLNTLFEYFCRSSVIVLILAIVSFYGYLFVYRSTPPDYMSFAYMMLTPIILCFMKGWKDNKIPFILSVVAAFILFIVGCRGAVVTLAMFLALYIIGFYMQGEAGRQKLGLKLVLLLVLVAIVINADTILNWIGLGLQGVGFTSRTVAKLLRGNGAFIESEGRWSIWSQAIGGIDFLGRGLFGDRTVIIDEYGHAAYAHNFLLEIMIDFGAILGLIIAVYFLYAVFKAMKVSRMSENPTLT